MGYTIRIGNAVPYHDKEDGCLSAGWRVEGAKHDDAPAFGEPTDYTNERWPSYSAWAESMKALGLHDLFLGRDSGEALMQNHPGCAMLTPEHAKTIKDAVAKRRRANGNRPAGFLYDIKGNPTGLDGDEHLARGEWLTYWVSWAVENCETPAIYNS